MQIGGFHFVAKTTKLWAQQIGCSLVLLKSLWNISTLLESCNGLQWNIPISRCKSSTLYTNWEDWSNANKLGGMDKLKNWDKSWTETFFSDGLSTVSPCPTSTAFQLRPLSSDDAWLPGPSEALRSVASDPNAQGNWLWGLDGRMSQETFRCEIATVLDHIESFQCNY